MIDWDISKIQNRLFNSSPNIARLSTNFSPQMVSGLAIAHVSLTLMLQGSLMVDSTDFCTEDNENAASVIQRAGAEDTPC